MFNKKEEAYEVKDKLDDKIGDEYQFNVCSSFINIEE